MKYLDRKQARDYIREQGIPIGDNFLPQAASDGTGPEYQYSGRHPLYREDKLDAWIEERLSVPVRSPSELRRTVQPSAPIDEPSEPPLGPPTRTTRQRRPAAQPQLLQPDAPQSNCDVKANGLGEVSCQTT